MKKIIAFILVAAVFFCRAAPAESLWERGNRGSLIRDTRAREVGDVITILIDERAEVSKESNRSNSKEASSDLAIDLFRLFGTERVTDELPGLKYDSSREFKGEADFESSDTFTKRLSVIVKEVLPNGNLVIEGKREIIMAGDETTIIISGIVRPADVSADNTVPSELVADAKIEYEGDGPAADSTKRGWLLSILDFIWPF